MAGYAVGIPRSLGALFDIGVTGDLSDGQLLDRYASGDREAAEHAFATLVERHGPMVLRICRRVLDDPNDADDAFQATFLVLMSQAGSIRSRGSVGAWLHGVASRVASRARVDSARRRRIERQGARPAVGEHPDPARLDLEPIIDGELAGLPEKYRQPVVLCYLEGLTHETAAARLGWPVGTVRGRLSRARDLLRSRLTRRGVTASAALAAIEGFCEPAKAAVPAALQEATVRAIVRVASGGTVAAATSARVAEWVAGVSRGLAVHRAMTAASVLVILGTVGTGLAMLAAPSPPPQAQADAQPDPREAIRREMLRLQGTWSAIRTEQHFLNDVPQPKTFEMIMSIDRDTIMQTDADGFASWTYRYTVDPSKSPKTIDLKSINFGGVLRGIYRLDGDALTICYGKDRPTRFEGQGPAMQLVLHRKSRTPTRLSPEYPNAEGCAWAIRPLKGPGEGLAFPNSLALGNINLILRKAPDGAIQLMLANMSPVIDGEPDLVYRPVALDRDKRRYLLEPGLGGSGSSGIVPNVTLTMQEFRLDPGVLPIDRLEALGIEAVPADVRRAAREAVAARAIQAAREAGIAFLSRPEVGKPLEFSLKDSRGHVHRSGDLKGKVVLIDCWASWSGSCTEKFPRLRALYERRRGDGLEVIGLNFDAGPGRGERLVKAMALPWPQVYVPGDEPTRRLWKEGPGLPSFPRSLLIDRQGILRSDGAPDDLEARIEAMLK